MRRGENKVSYEEFREGFSATMSAMAAATGPPIPFDEGDIPIPPRHTTYVQIIVKGGFFASCFTCGSEPFPDRQTLAEAEADARAHGQLKHLYSVMVLQEHDAK